MQGGKRNGVRKNGDHSISSFPSVYNKEKMTTTNRQKRIALFLIGCMGTRLALAWLAAKSSDTWLRHMGFAALVPAIGFMAIYLGGLRPTGPEVFGEPIWWNHLRPFHSIMYAVFATLALQGRRDMAWKVLTVDAIVGFAAFLAFEGSTITTNITPLFNLQ